MYYIPETVSEAYVPQEEITSAIEVAFAEMALGSARSFPVVREQLGYADAVFGIKSGFQHKHQVLGLKAGGFWPVNATRGLANHQSTIVLFNPDSGAPLALVRGNYLTGLRTAGASALSIKYLARTDAAVLGIVGSGAQSAFQIRAAVAQRDFRSLLIADKIAGNAERLIKEVSNLGLSARCCGVEELASRSDVIITITPSTQPVIDARWIRPGTHLACMGADTRGKQELDAAIFLNARVFCDDIQQAIMIGECQHAYALRTITESDITPIGNVICGSNRGREDNNAITVFDGTGVGLQDLVAARIALKIALDRGLAQQLD